MPRGRSKQEIARREREAAELRLAGVGYQSIADRLGFRSVSGAYDAVQRGLIAHIREPGTADIRQLELDRLDALLAGLWPKARRGNTAAVQAVLKLQERRARYLGLDAGHGMSVGPERSSPVSDIAAARAARRARAAGKQSS